MNPGSGRSTSGTLPVDDGWTVDTLLSFTADPEDLVCWDIIREILFIVVLKYLLIY